MRSMMRTFAVMAAAFGGASVFGQVVLRGVADNRSGNISVLANAPSGDPKEAGYNVDPGSNEYEPFDILFNEVDQRSGCTQTRANAAIDHVSEFINVDSQQRCRGIRAATSASGAVTVTSCGAGNTSSSSFGDNMNVVLRIENAPPQGTPIRVKSSATTSGGATVLVRILRPNGSTLLNLTSGSVNQLVNLPNGDYTVAAGISNGFSSRSSVGSTARGAAYSIGFWKECTGDIDGDGVVGPDDLSVVLAAYGATHAGDLTNDGVTDIEDLALLLSRYGRPCQ